jgi:hypothetical protein
VPTYGSSGDLVSGGGDLSLGGITAYYFDAIYLAIFVQITTVLSSKFWLVFLVVRLHFMDGATVSVLRLTLHVRRGSIKFTA